METRFLIIDGLNLIRRLHAALTNEADAKRRIERTQSLCIDAIAKMVPQFSATHLAIVFDSPVPTWRHKIYPDYKLGRPPMEDSLMQGIAQIAGAFRFNGWKCLRLEGWEADDVIATLASKAANGGVHSFIVSTDKGFTQLIQYPEVHIYDYFNKRGYDRAWVEDRYGVKIEQLADFWALTGDTTNHIQGVTGVGPKTAQKLIMEYGSLGGVFDAANQRNSSSENVLPTKLQEKLYGQDEHCALVKQLVSLRQDVSVGVPLSRFRISSN